MQPRGKKREERVEEKWNGRWRREEGDECVCVGVGGGLKATGLRAHFDQRHACQPPGFKMDVCAPRELQVSAEQRRQEAERGKAGRREEGVEGGMEGVGGGGHFEAGLVCMVGSVFLTKK